MSTIPAVTCDIAIIGGGIVGLATAHELLQRYPAARVVLLEKERTLAAHQTGRNSGVIHAGIYYQPGSLKATNCVQGRARLLQFCDAHGIAYDLCGKLIVATDADELPRLHALHERGQANGVRGLALLDGDELRAVEPYCVGVQALYSPATGIVDFAAVARTLARLVTQAGGRIYTGHRVTRVAAGRGGWQCIETVAGTVQARQVVSCAGLHADRLAQQAGGATYPRIVPFRGAYYVLHPQRAHLVRGLIYPVPDPRFPFLGVHFTRRIDGSVWLGPNAVLAWGREAYQRMQVAPRDLGATLALPAFWRLATRYWQVGLAEMYRDAAKPAFLAALQRFVPSLQATDMLPGPAGIRAQALAADGALVDDFVLERTSGVLHVRNAPSPAATASLAIAAQIADCLAGA